MDERERYEKGMDVRRAVLGDAHVDRALARRSDLTGEFQDLITRYAWGEIWTRPGLERRTRSSISIAMMVALNRSEELEAAPGRRIQQRRHGRGDQGGAAAGRGLLRGAGGQQRLSPGGGGVRGEGAALRRGVPRAEGEGRQAGAAREEAGEVGRVLEAERVADLGDAHRGVDQVALGFDEQARDGSSPAPTDLRRAGTAS